MDIANSIKYIYGLTDAIDKFFSDRDVHVDILSANDGEILYTFDAAYTGGGIRCRSTGKADVVVVSQGDKMKSFSLGNAGAGCDLKINDPCLIAGDLLSLEACSA